MSTLDAIIRQSGYPGGLVKYRDSKSNEALDDAFLIGYESYEDGDFLKRTSTSPNITGVVALLRMRCEKEDSLADCIQIMQTSIVYSDYSPAKYGNACHITDQ